ncbi:MAG: hypothetical protein ACYCSX_17105 [Acidimicrobiales bacterium]
MLGEDAGQPLLCGGDDRAERLGRRCGRERRDHGGQPAAGDHEDPVAEEALVGHVGAPDGQDPVHAAQPGVADDVAQGVGDLATCEGCHLRADPFNEVTERPGVPPPAVDLAQRPAGPL